MNSWTCFFGNQRWKKTKNCRVGWSVFFFHAKVLREVIPRFQDKQGGTDGPSFATCNISPQLASHPRPITQKTQGGSIMSFPKEIWDPQIPLGQLPAITLQLPRQQSKHTCRCISNHITKLVHFHSPPLDKTQPPGTHQNLGSQFFTNKPSSTSQRKITAGGSLGYQPLGGSFGAINRGHRGIHPKLSIRWKRIDVCMSFYYWVHGKCSKFFLGGGGYYDGIGTSGFQWIRNWFSDQTSRFFLTRLISIQSMMGEGNINQQVIHDLTIGFSRS